MPVFKSSETRKPFRPERMIEDLSNLIKDQLSQSKFSPQKSRRIERLSNDDLLVETGHGFYLVVPAWNIDVAIGIVRDGIIEPWTNDVFLSIVPEGGRVINVGANFGYYTMLAAQKAGRSGEVISVEANPVVFCYLVKGMFWAGYPDVVRAYNFAAVSPEMHGKPLEIAFDPQFIGGGNIFNTKSPRSTLEECLWQSGNVLDMMDEDRKFSPKGIITRATTQGRTIDSIVKQPVDAMLIDAEGSESFVVNGSMETIRMSPYISIIMEWDPFSYNCDDHRRPYIDKMWDFLIDEQKFQVQRVCHEGYRGLGTFPKLQPLNRASIFEVPHSDLLLTRS